MMKSVVSLVAAGIVGASALVSSSTVSNADEFRCREEAKRYADSRIDRGEHALGTAIGGAAVGAILGGIIGGGKGAGKGAIIGGSTGAVGSAVGTKGKWQRIYNRALDDCLDRLEPVRYRERERQPVYRAGPAEPWTDEWYDYCRAKYRSFNPRTGTFTGYDGVKYFCQAN